MLMLHATVPAIPSASKRGTQARANPAPSLVIPNRVRNLSPVRPLPGTAKATSLPKKGRSAHRMPTLKAPCCARKIVQFPRKIAPNRTQTAPETLSQSFHVGDCGGFVGVFSLNSLGQRLLNNLEIAVKSSEILGVTQVKATTGSASTPAGCRMPLRSARLS
jgi:hypothetical protein